MKQTCSFGSQMLMHKMPELQPCFLFLMVLAGSSLVSGNIKKICCSGASMELYSNISLNSDDIVVSLYKNGQHNKVIAMWSMQRSVYKEHVDKGYSKKVSLDKYGTLSIRNLDISDEGKYTVKFILRSWSTTYEVQLVVLVAPPTNCKPTITYRDNVLTASLKSKSCGNPAASVYWLDHTDHSINRGRRTKRNRQLKMTTHGKRKKVAYLQLGNQVGTYYACIKSPSLKCAGSSKPANFCTAYEVDENKSRSSLSGLSVVTTGTSTLLSTLAGPSAVPTGTSETQAKLSGFIAIGILSAILFLVIVTVVFIIIMVILLLRVKNPSKPLIWKEGPVHPTSSTLPGEVKTPSSPYVSIGFTSRNSNESSNREESQLEQSIIDSHDASEVLKEGNYDDNGQTKNVGSPYMNIPFTRTNSKDSSNRDETQNIQQGKIESTDVNTVESERYYNGDD